jgi:hypothetical protein
MFQISAVEKIRTHILYSMTFFFFFENLAVYEIMWNNIVQPETPQMKIWRVHIACWIRKTTHTHTHIYTRGMCDAYSLSTATVVA